MVSRRENVEKVAKPKSRKSRSNIELTDDELQALTSLWKNYHGGTRAFAAKMAELEYPAVGPLPSTIIAKVRSLHRIEDRDVRVSAAIFKTIAEVLGVTTKELRYQLSTSFPFTASTAVFGPWVTDEVVLSLYRTILHGYYLTKQGDDYFWMYSPIDFTAPYKGYLHALVNSRMRMILSTNFMVTCSVRCLL